ncbi:MAG: DegT/DnrJ/EryC1/StrS family aminotransferase [candidate division WOR-3 bacterium]
MKWSEANSDVMSFQEKDEIRFLGNLLGAYGAIPVSDPSYALRAGLFAMGIGPGCEVMVPAFGRFTPGPEVFSVGARPSYVDVGADIVLTRENLSRKLESEYKREGGFWVHRRRLWRLRAVIMTHPLGFSPFVDEIEDFAEEHGLILVDDARCALGSRIWSTKRSAWIYAGSAGRFGVACCNGKGYLMSDDRGLLSLIIAQMRSPGEDGLCTDALKEIRLEGLRKRRWLSESLATAGIGEIPRIPNYCQTSCSEVLLITEDDRDEIAEMITEKGFLAETDFWPLSVMFSSDRQYGYRKGRCPESEDIARRAIAVRIK